MSRVLRVLDVCSGSGSACRAFEDRGHEVRRLDVDGSLRDVDLRVDVREFARDPDRWLLGWRPDVVWASPPCTAFSLAGRVEGRWVEVEEWDRVWGCRRPGDGDARLGVALVLACLRVVEMLEPEFWWLENPVCRLRRFPFMERVEDEFGRVRVTYCRYWNPRVDAGLKPRMKPTDLWGVWPGAWEPRGGCSTGDPCHAPSPRGVVSGTQALHRSQRGMVPYELSNEVARACEVELGVGWG